MMNTLSMRIGLWIVLSLVALLMLVGLSADPALALPRVIDCWPDPSGWGIVCGEVPPFLCC